MPRKRWTHTACFEFFGTKPVNPRWSWSARSDDGKTVVVTLWQDEFQGGAGELIYVRAGATGWANRHGYQELMNNLEWARDQCGAKVRVIVAIKRDRNERPPRIAECFPQKKLVMRVAELDPGTGAFRLEQIPDME
jgi:hypothetical protein